MPEFTYLNFESQNLVFKMAVHQICKLRAATRLGIFSNTFDQFFIIIKIKIILYYFIKKLIIIF